FDREPFARAEIARLEELRLAALEDRVEADLVLASGAELVGELEGLVARHPLRERLRGQLMLALYRSGRQADSLAVYQRTRQLLVEGLGIEPSPGLQRLERAILLQEPSLEVVEPPAAAGLPAARAPAREVRKTVTIVFARVTAPGLPRDPESRREPISRS